jgi:hypothetical protein
VLQWRHSVVAVQQRKKKAQMPDSAQAVFKARRDMYSGSLSAQSPAARRLPPPGFGLWPGPPFARAFMFPPERQQHSQYKTHAEVER